jgi:hypothetical protein
MAEIVLDIVGFILTSAVIFFLIAFVAILLGRPKKPPSDQRGLDFSKLFIDYSDAPEPKSFTARDGTPLAYRHYPAESDRVIILFHGSGYHSRYLLPLAGFISSEGLAPGFHAGFAGTWAHA